MRDGIRPGSFWGSRVRETIAGQVDSIRHWRVYNRSYERCPTPRTATWFVDPPYEFAGQHYRFGSDQIDYQDLGRWCRSREGQVIVCENEGAMWLPFRPLVEIKTTRAKRRSSEVCWLRTRIHSQMAPKDKRIRVLLPQARSALQRLAGKNGRPVPRAEHPALFPKISTRRDARRGGGGYGAAARHFQRDNGGANTSNAIDTARR